MVDDRDHEGTADTRYLRRLRDAGIAAADDAVDLAEVVSGSHPGRTADDAAHRLLAGRASAWTTSSRPPTCCATRASAASAPSLRLREEPLWM